MNGWTCFGFTETYNLANEFTYVLWNGVSMWPSFWNELVIDMRPCPPFHILKQVDLLSACEKSDLA